MKDKMLCRRMFLKSSAFFAATVLGAKSAFAKFVEGGGAPEGKLSLYNVNSNERLTVTYRNSLGEYCDEAIQALNWIFRCHLTNETTKMDLRVLEYLNRLDNSLGGDNEIHIISGYRSPAYNARLRSRSKGVAKDSLHMKGMAIDLAIPSVGLQRIRHTAIALAAGGVGYYPQSGFVHIDSGQFRTW
ncbi:DUF882 domain-containing protein [Geomonas nitrogeniifigens]|uniref:DUF882 domain-containing protein n=1 Tax=Geomonas diazotrophica TaxID=2843197 RepID=A0ABX8JN26_9BACT|nr:DUF882 domain-containing protein [Geomonas nitrogeniifigens]QWV98972.1 DUF882 domain-containing protein [Geomonas nitrogeniifigens]